MMALVWGQRSDMMFAVNKGACAWNWNGMDSCSRHMCIVVQ
jgi:hypothetical protein